MSALSQVSGPERRGAAQARIVSLKAWSKRVLKPPCRSVFPKLREHLNSLGKSTMRGSGDHHRMGCCDEYQGKTPRSYALRSRVGLKSPPAASSPGGSRKAWSTGGNQFGSARSPSQTNLLRAAAPRPAPDDRGHAH